MINILHIDPDAGYRQTLERTLPPDLATVTVSHGSVEAAVAGLDPALPPDVVLLDPAKRGHAKGAIERLRRAVPSARIIILTDLVSIAQLGEAFEAGAMGY